jgi:anti-anti-sigma factor
MPLRITSTSAGGTTTLSVVGDVDLATRPVLWDALEKAVTVPGDTVVADLSGTTFLDCHGAGALVEARHLAERHGAAFVVRRPHGIPLLVLRETALLEYLCG